MPSFDETTALPAFREGDIGAFEWLAGQHTARALALAQGIVRSRADAEDVVQDALVRAWKHRESFAMDSRFGPRFFRIVTNRSLDVIRHRRTVEAHEASQRASSVEALPEVQLVTAEIRAAIAGLPPMQRTVAALYFLEGLSHAEIAARTSLKQGTVRSHLSIARKRLRERLG